MEKKNEIKISLSTLLLIIALIVILWMICYIYSEKTNYNKVISNLETNVSHLQKTVSMLEIQINSTPNISQNTTIDETKKTSPLKLGDYTVNDAKKDVAGVDISDNGIKLEENNMFSLYIGFGTWYKGKYSVENNSLICKADKLEWDGSAGPGEKNTTATFTFTIENENKLKLSDVKHLSDEKINQTSFAIGNTFSIK